LCSQPLPSAMLRERKSLDTMNKHWLHTDDKSDIIASLSMLLVALEQARGDITMWKWVVIATHGALQGAIACHLRGVGNNLLVAKQDDAEAWLRAHDQGTAHPKMMMDWFPNLYDKLKHTEIDGYKFTPQGNQGRSIKKINEYRNDFVHFMVNGFSLEISGIPGMCKDCLDVINELDKHTLHVRWRDEAQRAAFRKLLDKCLESIKGFELEYGT
ncbi:MAG TPA: hypothetical protein VLT51_10920, partial [Anaerolineales bacterium]|nr:hypothetical protein [Anaerolineales bacterium]